jgi:hypothetical protein
MRNSTTKCATILKRHSPISKHAWFQSMATPLHRTKTSFHPFCQDQILQNSTRISYVPNAERLSCILSNARTVSTSSVSSAPRTPISYAKKRAAVRSSLRLLVKFISSTERCLSSSSSGAPTKVWAATSQ